MLIENPRQKAMSQALATRVTENRVFAIGAIGCALMVFTIPLSTAFSIVMTFLIFACWVCSGQFKTLPALLRHNDVAASALVVYAVILLGVLYTSANSADALSMIRKYREFPLLVVLLPFMSEDKYRRWILCAWVFACLLTLAGSYLKYFGVIPIGENASASLKSRITHNLFMAFFAYFCGWQISAKSNPAWNVLWLGLWILTAFDIFVVVDGRTGQVVFVLLMLLYCFQRLTIKQAVTLSLLFLLVIAALLAFGNFERFNDGIKESQNYLSGKQNLNTSMGQRLYFWENTIRLVRERPILGFGTGSFEQQFNRITKGRGLSTRNPHNEYLMFLVQWGVVGLTAYFYFLMIFGRYSWNLPEYVFTSPFEKGGGRGIYLEKSPLTTLFQRRGLNSYLPEDRRWFAMGVTVSLFVNSLFNTTFLDHSEGHWYASLIALSLSGAHARDFDIASILRALK